MEILRTPEARFAALPDFPFEPRYLEVAPGLRVHYVDEGPRDAPVVLMLHGEPTWCYLYRHMIPLVVAAGLRAVAPDLVGFGRSDKPADRRAHSYAAQVGWMRAWIEALDLGGITLACQDWGSLIGLRLAAECEERFAAVALANGGLPVGGGRVPPAFALWRAFARWSPVFPVGRIVQAGTLRRLGDAERAAYEAPFPDARHAVAARVYPTLVPTAADDPANEANRRAWAVLERWEKPFATCFSHADPITRGLDRQFVARVPGARGVQHPRLRGGHFVQEDDPQGFAAVAIALARSAR